MNLTQRFEPLRQAHWPPMRELIAETIARTNPPASSLGQLCAYHFDTGGKRLRAVLPLWLAEALGRNPAQLRPFGAACEMLHNATLVHDDLQDGDAVRRGRPTVWHQFGAARAINLGDAMFYYAVLLIRGLDAPAADRDRVVDLLLHETLRVIDGQEREVFLRNEGEPSLDGYLAMIAGKTAGLFALPLKGAAILCRAGEPVIDALGEVGLHLGVLFQIQDDLLDLFADKGRASGSDIGEGKRSILVVHALHHAASEQRRWLLDTLEKPREETTDEDVDEARRLFIDCGALQAALQEITNRHELARQAASTTGQVALVELVDALADLFTQPIAAVGTRHGRLGSTVSGEDVRLCHELLPEVSRTFALSIAALPGSLREAVLTAYLLCRIVDTIEDEPALAPSDRDLLFDNFVAALGDGERDPATLVQAFASAGLTTEKADGRLCAHADAVLRLFRALPAAQSRTIRPRVLVMLEGMRSYCRRAADEGGLRMRDLEDVERYCYYVAGTVGRLLTDLFLLATPSLDAECRQRVQEHAVSFGIGLQLVNMVKDVAEDLARGTCFLPLDLARRQGVPLEEVLAPGHRRAGLPLVWALCERARTHLARAEIYTLTWPVPDGLPVRMFCAVPLALALATLHEVEVGHDTLRPDSAPKIDRATVTQILTRAAEAVGDDQRLREVLSSAAGRRSG